MQSLTSQESLAPVILVVRPAGKFKGTEPVGRRSGRFRRGRRIIIFRSQTQNNDAAMCE